jgi:hypothetical protein
MGMGLRRIANFNDSLRYSLGPPEKVLLIRYNYPILIDYYHRVNKCNDSRKKCLDELVLPGKRCNDSSWSIKIFKRKII